MRAIGQRTLLPAISLGLALQTWWMPDGYLLAATASTHDGHLSE
jgi:hypothetical protein